MRIFVSTSDNYLHLLKKHSYFFNKHWHPDQKVDVLCYKVPDFELPPNYNIISLGSKSGSSWTDPIREFITSIPEDHFVFLLEDLFIIQKVEFDLLGRMCREIRHNQASKAVLERQYHWRMEPFFINSDFMVIDQNAEYRMTLKPAIWRKEYFLKYLKPGYSIWDFETKNPEAKNDGAFILQSRGGDVLRTADAMKRGHRADNLHVWLGKMVKDGSMTKQDFDFMMEGLLS